MMVSPSSNYQLLSCTLMPQILNLKFINSMRVLVCIYTYLSSLFFLIRSLLPLSLHCECVSDHLQDMYYYLNFIPLFPSSSFTLLSPSPWSLSPSHSLLLSLSLLTLMLQYFSVLIFILNIVLLNISLQFFSQQLSHS